MKNKYCNRACPHMHMVVDKRSIILYYCSRFALEPEGRAVRLACENGKPPYRIMRCRG